MIRLFGAEALKQGGALMAPLLLLSIAVLSAGFERLIYWLSWRREQPGCLDALRTSLSGLTNAEASRVLEQRLRRLDH